VVELGVVFHHIEQWKGATIDKIRTVSGSVSDFLGLLSDVDHNGTKALHLFPISGMKYDDVSSSD